MKEKADKLRSLAYVPRVIAMVWQAARYRTAAWFVLMLIQGTLPVLAVSFTKHVVDALVGVIRSGSGDFATLLMPVAGLAACLLLIEVLREVIAWIRTGQAELVEDYIKGCVHDKVVELEVGYFDSADFQDRLHRASSEASLRPLALLENLSNLCQNTVTLLGMAVLLIPYGLWLPPALLLSSAPILVAVSRMALRHHEWWKRRTADRRWIKYFDRALTTRSFAEEIRLFQLGDLFKESYRLLRARLRKERLELARQEVFSKLAAALVTLSITGAVMAWMVWRVIQGAATLGDLTLFYQIFTRGQSLLKTALSNMGEVFRNALFVKDLFEFLELEPSIQSPGSAAVVARRASPDIIFRNVSFTYPGGHRPVFKDLNLRIPANQITAIVGSNGGGKSTLFKLICRLYDVQQGSLEIGGTDVRDMTMEELRSMLTMLFQWPVCYQATAEANVFYGDVNRKDSTEEIHQAAKAAGAHDIISALPEGYSTLLGRGFANGVELSGGQWQRIALARAIFRSSPILLLDEPTSFMDSWAETDWLGRLRESSRGRTVVIVTHRLTTALAADSICLLEQGEVLESGSHEELIASDGAYARSWHAQTGNHRPASQVLQAEASTVRVP